MADFQKLNNIDHQNVRVQTGFGAQFGDDVMFVLTFPEEMRSIQAHYPILIHKDPVSGKFSPIALLGFERGENLFLQADRWDASYVPAMMRSQPFLIGEDKSSISDRQHVVAIDMEHPRVSLEVGEPLFLEQGGPSDFLESKATLLEHLRQASETNDKFVTALVEHGLVQSVTLSIKLSNGESYELQDFFGIDDDALQRADGRLVTTLAEAGWLMPCFMMVASMSQLGRLVERRNRSLE